ncbi:MAG: nucleotidyltransferase family protein [Bacteroides sp.]|nr:nucleotidyltransferase family protein [Bacteroides sp.]
MKAFILAAGLGTRLKPFTLTNPKALVPVGGVPMLERVLLRLRSEGFDDIVVNIHHFGEKIVDFVHAHADFGMRVRFSDERDFLCETGGGILHALPMLAEDDRPFLIHNVDILSDAPLASLMRRHEESGADASLVVSGRDSSRRLVFSERMRLRGWHNLTDGALRPEGFLPAPADREYAFSGIHIMNPAAVGGEMLRQRRSGKFSVIDFYLDARDTLVLRADLVPDLHLIDIGKPATLSQAQRVMSSFPGEGQK